MSAFEGEEGNVLIGGEVTERILVVISKVDLDPPKTGSRKMERRGEEDKRLIAKQPEVRDKAPNADTVIRGGSLPVTIQLYSWYRRETR